MISIAAFQLIVVESTCSTFLGSCDKVNCDVECKAAFPNGKGTCDYNNLCTCFFDGLPKNPLGLQKCQIGDGKCTDECDQSCCNSNCGKNYKDGVGQCINVVSDNLCICIYSP
ncbi:Defensin-like protein [Trifolium repens]|nr:Defensin-like protein [Trifolium repens]